MTVRPITPEEAAVGHEATIPAIVITTVNRLLKAHGNKKQIVLKQKEIVAGLFAALKAPDKVFEIEWLDFEDIYRRAGWKVTYNKAGLGEECYEANFTFTKA